MVTKEYQCNAGHISTLRERMSEDTREIPCAKCGQPAERIISLSSVQVVGGTPTHHSGANKNSSLGPINVGDID